MKKRSVARYFTESQICAYQQANQVRVEDTKPRFPYRPTTPFPLSVTHVIRWANVCIRRLSNKTNITQDSECSCDMSTAFVARLHEA